MALFNDPDNAAAANKIAQGAINGTLSIYNNVVQNIGNNRAKNSLEQAAYQGTTDNLFDFTADKTRFENLDRSINNTNFYSDARSGEQLQDDIRANMGKMKEMNQGLRPMSAGQMWASAGSKALQGAALGASIGSFFPGAGTLIGGAIGTAVGGAMGAFQRGKQRKIARSNIKAQNAYERMSDGMEQTLNNIDNYELQNMGYNTFAEGGFPMPAQGDQGMPSASTEFNEGGIHETNPYGGIPIGKAPDGKPNLVEEGEVRLNNSNYILSNRLIIDKKSAEEMGLPKKYIGKTFAEAYKMRTKDYKNSENDPITKKGLQAEEERFIQGQEAAKQKLAPQGAQMSPEEQAMLDQQMAQNMPNPEMVGAGMQDPSMISQQGGMPAEQADPAMMAEQGMMAYGGYPYASGGIINSATNNIYDGGGFVEFMDSYADPSTVEGALAKGTLQLLDPTGISSYPDVYYSGRDLFNDPSWENLGNFGLNLVGALPLIGKIAAPFKAAKMAKLIDKVGDATELVKTADRIEDVNKKIDTLQELIPITRKAAKKTQDVTTSLISDPLYQLVRRGKNKSEAAKAYRRGNAVVNYVNGANNTADIVGTIQEAVNPNKKSEGGYIFDEGGKPNNISFLNLRLSQFPMQYAKWLQIYYNKKKNIEEKVRVFSSPRYKNDSWGQRKLREAQNELLAAEEQLNTVLNHPAAQLEENKIATNNLLNPTNTTATTREPHNSQQAPVNQMQRQVQVQNVPESNQQQNIPSTPTPPAPVSNINNNSEQIQVQPRSSIRYTGLPGYGMPLNSIESEMARARANWIGMPYSDQQVPINQTQAGDASGHIQQQSQSPKSTQSTQSTQSRKPSGPEKYYIKDHDMSATKTDIWRDTVTNWNQANVDVPGTTEYATYMRFKQLTDPNSPMYNARFANSASAKKVGDFSNPEAIKEMLSDGKWGVAMESFTHMADPATYKLGAKDYIYNTYIKPKTVEDELLSGNHPMSKYTTSTDGSKGTADEPREESGYERGVQGAPVDKAGLGINWNIPIAGLGLMRAYRPVDYTHANHIEDLPNGLKRANYTPLNNYMTPQYVDQQYLDAQHAAEANAGTRALMQAGANSPNSSAALLANNVNNQAARGQNRLMAMQANNMEDKAVAQHNLGVDQANAQMYQNNSQFNTGQYNQARLNTGMTASQLRLQQDQAREQNIDDSWASLGDVLQRDRSDRMKYNMILNDDGIYYDPISGSYKRLNNPTGNINTTQSNTQSQQNTQYQEPAIVSVNDIPMPVTGNTQNNTPLTNGTPQLNSSKKKDNFDLGQPQGNSNNTQINSEENSINTNISSVSNNTSNPTNNISEKEVSYIEPSKLPEVSNITQNNIPVEAVQSDNVSTEMIQPRMPKMAPELNIQDTPMSEEDLYLLDNAELNDTYFMPNINAGINPNILRSEMNKSDEQYRKEQDKFFNDEYRNSVRGIMSQPDYRKGLNMTNEIHRSLEAENQKDDQGYNNLLDQEMQEFNNEFNRQNINNFTPNFDNIENTINGLNPIDYSTGKTIFPEVSDEELYNKLNPFTDNINNSTPEEYNAKGTYNVNNNIGDDIRNYYLMENAKQLGRNTNYDLNNPNSSFGFNSQGDSMLNMDLYKKHKALEANLKSLETERKIKEDNGDAAGVAAVDQQIANSLPSVEVSEDPNKTTVLTDTQRRIANGGSVISSDNTSEKTSIFNSDKFKNTNFAKQRREIKALNERSKKGGTKEQVDVITFANQHNTQPWYVLDKKTNTLTRYEWKDGKLTTDSITKGITIGINKGDDMTITYTDEDGSIKNKAGNMMTGAGIFEIGGIYEDSHYGGTKQYALKSAVTGLEGPMLNHLYSFERGLRGSNGCPSFNAEAYAHLSTWNMKSGQKYYILPEDEGNFFYMNGDVLKLSSPNPKVNRGGKDPSNVVKPMDITIKGLEDPEQQIRMKNVEVIMEDPEFRNEFKEAFNLSDTQYNNVMLLTGAVMGKESNYGEGGEFLDVFRTIAKARGWSESGPKVGGFWDNIANDWKDHQTSSGYGQIFSRRLRDEAKVYSGIAEVNESKDKRLSKIKAKNNEPLSFVNTKKEPITLNTFKKENPESWKAMTEAEQKAVSAYIEQNASNYKKYKYLAKYDMLRNQDYAAKQRPTNAMTQTSWYKKQNFKPVAGYQHDAAGSTISTMAMVASVISRLGSLGQDVTDEMLEAFAKQYNGSGNYKNYAAGLKERLLGNNIFIE